MPQHLSDPVSGWSIQPDAGKHALETATDLWQLGRWKHRRKLHKRRQQQHSRRNLFNTEQLHQARQRLQPEQHLGMDTVYLSASVTVASIEPRIARVRFD